MSTETLKATGPGFASSNLTIPNLLSGLRIASIPALLYLAWRRESQAYLVCLGISLLTDLLDGLLARLLNQRTELGARLDLWADVGVFLSWPAGLWWLWPEVLRSNQWLFGVAIASYLASAALAIWKFGRPASYHSWLGKTGTMGLAIGGFLVMLDWAQWPFRLGMLLVIGAILEEIAISLTLKEPRSNVQTWWHARRLSSTTPILDGLQNARIPSK